MSQLRSAVPALRAKYGVSKLSVFGSVVSGETHAASDVDLLVEFDRVPGFFMFVELEDELSQLLQRKVDLVMKQANCLVFVEVRMRAETKYGEGLDTVGWQKQRKLIKTALYYQQKEDYWGDLRFDVVSIVSSGDGSRKIEHIKDAFVVEV